MTRTNAKIRNGLTPFVMDVNCKGNEMRLFQSSSRPKFKSIDETTTSVRVTRLFRKNLQPETV